MDLFLGSSFSQNHFFLHSYQVHCAQSPETSEYSRHRQEACQPVTCMAQEMDARSRSGSQASEETDITHIP